MKWNDLVKHEVQYCGWRDAVEKEKEVQEELV